MHLENHSAELLQPCLQGSCSSGAGDNGPAACRSGQPSAAGLAAGGGVPSVGRAGWPLQLHCRVLRCLADRWLGSAQAVREAAMPDAAALATEGVRQRSSSRMGYSRGQEEVSAIAAQQCQRGPSLERARSALHYLPNKVAFGLFQSVSGFICSALAAHHNQPAAAAAGSFPRAQGCGLR